LAHPKAKPSSTSGSLLPDLGSSKVSLYTIPPLELPSAYMLWNSHCALGLVTLQVLRGRLQVRSVHARGRAVAEASGS